MHGWLSLIFITMAGCNEYEEVGEDSSAEEEEEHAGMCYIARPNVLHTLSVHVRYQVTTESILKA